MDLRAYAMDHGYVLTARKTPDRILNLQSGEPSRSGRRDGRVMEMDSSGPGCARHPVLWSILIRAIAIVASSCRNGWPSRVTELCDAAYGWMGLRGA